MNGYIKNFADKNNKLMLFSTDDDKLLEKKTTISSKVKNLKYIELYAFPVYNDRKIKTKIITHGVKVCTISKGLNVQNYRAEYKSRAVIYIDSLLFYEKKYYLKVYLDKCAYKVIDIQMIYYLDDSLIKIGLINNSKMVLTE